MRDSDLLNELLSAEEEADVATALEVRGLFDSPDRWRHLGNMPNNQSVVHAQQSTAAAALVEKVTNAIDAILIRHCRQHGIDPRSDTAPRSMSEAVQLAFGDLADLAGHKAGQLAEDHLLLYATGTKRRPSISLYDAGEGQKPEDFPQTFCSLIYGARDDSERASYKGSIPFVQGRFNMGGTGVLPFCGEKLRSQLIVSRVPPEIAQGRDHEWAYTLFVFFPEPEPSWRYLVGRDQSILTAGTSPLNLIPHAGVSSGTVSEPRARAVESGTLIKMYDYKTPRSNICGELYRKLEDYLITPALPLRLIECRPEYKAKVMRNTVWNRLKKWSGSQLEPGFEEGASISISLSTGEVVAGEIRVFKVAKQGKGANETTGLRALINGQSHAKRDAQFFRAKAVDKEHIADSMLVTLDCTDLSAASRNSLFMSNREQFRDDILLKDLFDKLKRELKTHQALKELNERRYRDKIKDATTDVEGTKALEELLETDPDLAELFGSLSAGRVAAPLLNGNAGPETPGEPQPYQGKPFPTYIRRADGSTQVDVEIPQKGSSRASFQTDVENRYFSRHRHRGRWAIEGDAFVDSVRLYNGRLTLTCRPGPDHKRGQTLSCLVTITDNKGSGPFRLTLNATVVEPQEKSQKPKKRRKPNKKDPTVPTQPTSPDIRWRNAGEEAPVVEIDKDPNTERLVMFVNKEHPYLGQAKAMRNANDVGAVEFIYKFGLALVAMGLLDQVQGSSEWKEDEAGCRRNIANTVGGVARVIVPLCLTLPEKLPKR